MSDAAASRPARDTDLDEMAALTGAAILASATRACCEAQCRNRATGIPQALMRRGLAVGQRAFGLRDAGGVTGLAHRAALP